jgi:hypothetical protein
MRKGFRMTNFRVGEHEVKVFQSNDRWTVVHDGVALPLWFMTEAEAWARVSEADRIDTRAA